MESSYYNSRLKFKRFKQQFFRAHRAQAVRNYGRSVKEDGLKESLRKRDEPFGEGFARVGEPEGRAAVVRAALES